MQLLTATQIKHKTERMALEILEHHIGETELILAGINNNGARFAERLRAVLRRRAPHIALTMANIRVNPANPIAQPITLSLPAEQISQKVVIVIDDVANTGRTAYYALRPLLDVLCKKVEIAVLVDRKHKSFPAQPDYVALSLATTLRETIDVRLDTEDEGVYLRE